MHCHGKCHLKKEMQKEDTDTSSSGNKEEGFVLYHSVVGPFCFSSILIDHYNFMEKEKTEIGHVKNLLRPPCNITV